MHKPIFLFAYLLVYLSVYQCIKRTAYNFHCDCDNPGDGAVNGTLSRRSAWHCVVIVAKQYRWEDRAVYTRKFSNFAQIISRQAECAKMKLAVVPRGVSQLQQYLMKFTTWKSHRINQQVINECDYIARLYTHAAKVYIFLADHDLRNTFNSFIMIMVNIV